MEVDSQPNHNFEYDLFVIGGGSGGLSAARYAVEAGKKVALADFVQPSPVGTKWGLGGTCVNVGCIPKKMMHYAALLAEAREDQELSGFKVDRSQTHDWSQMVMSVQMHIKSLNWGYKADLLKLNVKYYNHYARFVDAHTVELDNGKEKVTVTADKIVIATGGRPNYPGIPGDKEFGITSDDLFSLKKAPGKTLVVGASYVALECAGFLTALGYDTTVMVRSIFLRGFDQDMANLIASHMALGGTKFIRNALPSKLEKPDAAGRIKVTWNSEGAEHSEEFDTVLFAIGRYALTEGINCAAAGVEVQKNGKFIVNEREQTNVPHIFALGDVQHGKLELTPTAIKAGMLLSRREFLGETELMDYTNVPTTVFTPLEYGCVGLTEAEAKEKFGADNVATYHTEFKPLEWSYNKESHDAQRTCYTKVLVNKADDRVVGFHLCAPNAGEVTQGIGVAFKCGMTKKMLDSCVGIHPTVAEDVIGLKYTKEEHPVATKSGC